MNKLLNNIVLPGITLAMLGLTTGAMAKWGGSENCDGPGMSRDCGDKGPMSEKRIARLHDQLKLNDTQEQAWKTFIAKGKEMRPKERPDPKEMEGLNAPQRMEKMISHMHEREEKMTAMLASLKDFYAVLTPEQQKTFDDSLPKRGEGRWDEHHRGDRHSDKWKEQD